MKPGLKARGNARFRGGKVGRIKKPLTRKERRKQERSARKQRTAIFHSRNKSHVDFSEQNAHRIKKKPQKTGKTDVTINRNHFNVKKTSDDDKEEERKSKKVTASQSSAMMRENKEIARLEKLLKMKKRKKLPTLFKEEGLDYLLDLTEKSSSEWNLSDDESELEEMTNQQQESDSEPEETTIRVSRPHSMHRKGAVVSGKSVVSAPQKGILKDKKASAMTLTKEEQKKRVRFSLEGKSLPDTGDHSDSSSNDDDDAIVEMEEGDSDDDEITDIHDPDMEDSDDLSEQSDDGYTETSSSSEEEMEGEGEDEATPQLVSDSANNGASHMYVPPHLREGKTSKNQERLRKAVQGLINRLSESNMQSISSQLEELYRENSRNDMNTTLSEVLLKSCVSPALLSDRLALEHMMLVAILHHKVGQEVGAHVVQSLAKKLGLLLGDRPNYGVGKECDCIVLMLAHLYNYRVIHCLLIYDVIRKLVESFSERDVELLLVLLKSTGMEIRKDDAASLKDIILQIQSKAVSSTITNSSRMRFMLDTIAALRTNNARKIPNYDPSLLEHMKKLLRGIVHSSGSLDESQLKISLQDLLNADTQGRWWIVGSAWVGRDTNSAPSSQQGASGDIADVAATSESWVLELARRQRMNTDVRKNVFCVIMTSEDYVDAFEKLVRLGLKEVQEREIVHVLVDCCLQEKTFNPYYAHLGQKFCEFKRSHQVTFQYALWDRFKALSSLTKSNRVNLRKLVCHLVSNKSLSLSVLKVVEFGQLEETEVKFYKTLLRSILVDNSEEIVTAIFARLAPLPALKQFRTELILYIKHFLGQPASASTAEGREELLTTRIKLAEQAMKAHGHVF